MGISVKPVLLKQSILAFYRKEKAVQDRWWKINI